MIIEFIRRSLPIIVDMTGSPFVVIEGATEVSVKIHLKTKEMGKYIQTSLGKQKNLFFFYHSCLFLGLRHELMIRLSLKRLSRPRTSSFLIPDTRSRLHFVAITIDLKK